MHILIVEDENTMSMIMSKIVGPIVENFPNSTIQIATHLYEALDVVARTPAPDIVLLDLSLPDSTMENTIAKLTQIEDRSPVVIVTGHARESLESLLAGRDTEFIQKQDADFFKSGYIIGIILRVLQRRKRRDFEQMDTNIERMRTLLANGSAN